MDLSRLLVTIMIVLALISEIHCRRRKENTEPIINTSSEPSIRKTIKTAVINEIPGLMSIVTDTLKRLVLRQPKPEDVQNNSGEPALGPIPAGPALQPFLTNPMEQAMPGLELPMPGLEQSMPGFPFGPKMPGRPQFPFTAHYYQDSQESLHNGSAITKCNQLAIISIIIARIMAFL